MSAYLRNFWCLMFLSMKFLHWMDWPRSPTHSRSYMFQKMKWLRWKRLTTFMNCRFLNLVPTDYGLVLKNICNPSSIVVENSQVSLGVNVCTCVCKRERERMQEDDVLKWNIEDRACLNLFLGYRLNHKVLCYFR